MKLHAAATAAVCLHHLRWLQQLRRPIVSEIITRPALELTMTQLRYCNSVRHTAQLHRFSACRLQNASAGGLFSDFDLAIPNPP
jgi:hypothetical protein